MKQINIQQIIDIPYVSPEREARRKGGGGSQEWFTPYSIIKRMCDKISKSDWADPEKTFGEPCFGNGNILLYIIYNRLKHKIDWETTLRTTYGVELFQDNVDECKERILNLLDQLEIDYDKNLAMHIMNENLVCHDFFTWDFINWREYTQVELDLMKKPKKEYDDGITQEPLF